MSCPACVTGRASRTGGVACVRTGGGGPTATSRVSVLGRRAAKTPAPVNAGPGDGARRVRSSALVPPLARVPDTGPAARPPVFASAFTGLLAPTAAQCALHLLVAKFALTKVCAKRTALASVCRRPPGRCATWPHARTTAPTPARVWPTAHACAPRVRTVSFVVWTRRHPAPPGAPHGLSGKRRTSARMTERTWLLPLCLYLLCCFSFFFLECGPHPMHVVRQAHPSAGGVEHWRRCRRRVRVVRLPR